MDKTIEVVKAAMDKEKKAKQAEKAMDEKIDNLTGNNEPVNSAKSHQEETEAGNITPEDGLKEETDNAKKEQKPSDDKSSEDKEAPDIKTASEEANTEEKYASEEEKDSKSEDEKASKSGKSLFKNAKTRELEAKLEAKEQKIQELTDKLMRVMAEFDNFRKRTEKEKSQMFDLGVKSTIEKLLPVVDNFERGLGAIDEANKDNSIVQGFNMIYKQLVTMLDDIGVKPIEAVGKQFDPNYHNAVMHNEDENLGENIVAEEFQKGYMYKDMVVRHSMVRVVN